MALLDLQQRELTDLAKTYGTVYETQIGEVSYTKLVSPEDFVLLAKDDQLRYYLYRKPNGIWEHVWGASSIVHDGLPTAEALIQWRLNHAFNSGKQGLANASVLGTEALELAASGGTSVHKAAEDVLNGKKVLIVGRSRKQMEGITSFANFVTDFKLRNWQTEQIVAHDKIIDGIRIVFAGTVDLIVEIFNPVLDKWETWLIDYKTSKDVQLSHRVQTVGYAAAAAQSRGIKIDRIGVLLLGKQTQKGYLLTEVGKERVHPITFDDFVLAYKMVLLVNGGKLPGPTYKTYPKSIQIKQEKQSESMASSPTPTGSSSSVDTSKKASKTDASSGGAANGKIARKAVRGTVPNVKHPEARPNNTSDGPRAKDTV